MLVLPVQGGNERLAIQGDTSRSVASVMKVFTTGAALQLLGPAFTWKTEVGLGGAITPAGILRGPLYLRGSGDPALVLERWHLFMARWRAAGLHDIHGDIVLDRQRFQVPQHDPAAFDGRALKPYNAGPDALLLNHRALILRFRPDDVRPGLVRVSLEPQLDGMDVVNRTRLVEGVPCGDWREALTLSLTPDGSARAPERQNWRIEVKGPYPRACEEKDWPLLWTGDSANDYAERLMTGAWRQMGGHLNGVVRDGSWPTGLAPWMSWSSPPLTSVIYDINKFSNNVMARQVFLTLGNDAPPDASLGGSAPATTERARQRVGDWLASRKLRFDELVLDNGSGLSRSERISAGSLNRLLLDAWKNPVMPEFVSSLPIVGIDGTMKKRLRDAAATGRAHIKTGTLDGVKTAAGYALDAQGRRHAVTFLINHPRAQAGSVAIDALIDWVAQRRSGERNVVLENE